MFKEVKGLSSFQGKNLEKPRGGFKEYEIKSKKNETKTPSSIKEAFGELKKFKVGRTVTLIEGGKFGNFILKEGVRGTITKLENKKATIRINYSGTKAKLEIPKSKLKVTG